MTQLTLELGEYHHTNPLIAAIVGTCLATHASGYIVRHFTWTSTAERGYRTIRSRIHFPCRRGTIDCQQTLIKLTDLRSRSRERILRDCPTNQA